MKRRGLIVCLALAASFSNAASFTLVAEPSAAARAVVSVKDYGASGNGLDDDTGAFQEAFHATADVFIPAGTYRITSSLTLPHPFKVVGAGAEVTVLQFENMGGFSGSSGIVITAGGHHAVGYMSDLTVAIKGADGRSAIQTPRGRVVCDVHSPTYVFQRMKFRGDQENAAYRGLYDHGWARYFDVGDGSNHVFRDISIYGYYNYTVDQPSAESARSTAFYFSAEQNEGGVVAPLIDHCFTHYVGESVEFGYCVDSPGVVNSQFHRGCRGIHCPVESISPTNYGVRNVQLRTLNLNSQLECVSFAKSDFIDIKSVRATRAAGGIDHGNTWTGFKFQGVNHLDISNVRSYNAGTGYSGLHVGMSLAGCSSVRISGYNARQNLDYGLILEDTGQASIFGATFFWPASSAIYFKGVATSGVSISAASYILQGGSMFTYEPEVDKSGILFRNFTAAN